MVKKKKKKRVVVISDLHCGHRIGLTPPDYAPRNTTKWYAPGRALWREYKRMIKERKGHGPIDLLLVMGDGIDGRGKKSGSTELIQTDLGVQCKMAAACINEWDAKEVVMVFGTAYHVGSKEDNEETIAGLVGARKIGGQEWVQVDDVMFDLKHFVGGSGIPHGAGTPLAKEWLWNLVWNIRGEQPKTDIFLRGHQHAFNYVGNDSFLAMTLPALQGLGSKFGTRIPSKRVDFGIVYFDIKGDEYTWGWDIVVVKAQKPKVLQF